MPYGSDTKEYEAWRDANHCVGGMRERQTSPVFHVNPLARDRDPWAAPQKFKGNKIEKPPVKPTHPIAQEGFTTPGRENDVTFCILHSYCENPVLSFNLNHIWLFAQ